MPACGQAVRCGVCDTPRLWRGAAGLCARARACADAAETLPTYIHTCILPQWDSVFVGRRSSPAETRPPVPSFFCRVGLPVLARGFWHSLRRFCFCVVFLYKSIYTCTGEGGRVLLLTGVKSTCMCIRVYLELEQYTVHACVYPALHVGQLCHLQLCASG